MKKFSFMKKFSILLSMMFTFTLFSCDETEGVIYDGGQTFVSFDSSTAELPIVIDATGEVAIPVLVSSTSNEDRIATIEIDLENSTADPQNYSVPPTVVIPANSFGKAATLTFYLAILSVAISYEHSIYIFVIAISFALLAFVQYSIIGSNKLKELNERCAKK